MIAYPAPNSKSGIVRGALKKREIAFTKMHGLGNDFVVVFEDEIAALSQDSADVAIMLGALARFLCDRHYGIGADGLIIVRKPDSDDCDLAWSYRNSDGSASYMCGNGLRCLALWAVERDLVKKNEFRVATGAQIVTLNFKNQDEITVDLGEPVLRSDLIPVSGPERSRFIGEVVSEKGKDLTVSCVNMGNPHCVLFAAGISVQKQEQVARMLQASSLFPEGVNVEFAEIESRTKATVRVFERGAGFTLACASGAAAVLVAGVLEGRMERQAVIKLPGGELFVEWRESNKRVWLSGPAREIYNARIDLSSLIPEGRL